MPGEGFEKGNQPEKAGQGQPSGSQIAPCFLCGEPRGTAVPCPHCGVAELE